MKKSIKCFVVLIAVFFTVSCSKEFLDNPPQDKLVLDNFYTTDGQVLGSGSGLYARPWFYFNEKFIYGVAEMTSGNARTGYSPMVPFENLTVDNNNQFVYEGWQSLFNVIAQSNTLLYNLENNAKGITPEVLERVKGEAYFMRATAYFYLVRTFGAVPLLNKIEQYTENGPIYRNNVADVYQFIINDYNTAYQKLPKTTGSGSLEKGRLIKSASDAMLAKVYITLKDYPNAQLYAEKVINSGDYTLIDDYGLLFNNPNYNNSRESIFSLEWAGCSGYGTGNSSQVYITPNFKIGGGANSGYGTFIPTIDLRRAYEAGDKRRKSTIMLPGDFYPELVTTAGGYVVPQTGCAQYDPESMGFRKYVIGSPVEFSGVCNQSTGQNTCMMRYADVLLIEAEAVLAGGASTSSPQALSAINQVRARAGLSAKTSITPDDVFKERRVELALEGDFWYDLVRRNRVDAKNIIESQERGTYSNIALQAINSKKVKVLDEKIFLFSIPDAELKANPLLNNDPVPFQF